VVSAYILLFSTVHVPYTFDLLSLIYFVLFSLWSEFQTPYKYYLALIDLFDQCENSVLAKEHDELQCVQQLQGVQKSCAIAIMSPSASQHKSLTLRERS